jgi:tight adherence protein B
VSPSAALAAIPLRWLAVTGGSLLSAGMFGVSWWVLRTPDSLPRALWARYVAFLDAKLRVLFSPVQGARVALAQLAALGALVAVQILARPSWTVLAAAVVAFAPAIVLARKCAKRKRGIEAQLNGFTLGLVHALKAAPSVANAFQTMVDLTAQPMQSEIAYAVKAMRLGASLDQALLLMASRIGSPDFDAIASSMLIGRNVGGDLPTVLEATAGALREMSRLEQVVRVKTAEGKAQLWVLAIFPLFLIFGLGTLMPSYFDVLFESLTGYVLAGISVACWGGSIVVARRIINFSV